MHSTIEHLMTAQNKAIELFSVIEQRGLIVPGRTERELCDEIVRIAKEDFGAEQHWGKRIVRTGKNTLQPYAADPEDLTIQNEDILFFDFHPVFDGWEADLGRTYVVGSDPLKLKIKKDVESAWQTGNTWYAQQSHLTGAEFFRYAVARAKSYGYEFGNAIEWDC
jgi:Xaa-Pro dipeptidase